MPKYIKIWLRVVPQVTPSGADSRSPILHRLYPFARRARCDSTRRSPLAQMGDRGSAAGRRWRAAMGSMSTAPGFDARIE
jgi:hypothetical protein